MIHLYDGNNVLLRQMTTKPMPGQVRLSLRQRFEAMANAPRGTRYWCFDGKGHNERRQALYPEYKANREPMAENHFAQIRLWKDLLTHTNATQIEVEAWEADDVIATMARRFAAAGHPIVIHSNDADYLQLTLIPNITVNGVTKILAPPRWIPLYKALVGDSSDNIAGVPGFGPKTWEGLEQWWPDIEQGIVHADPEAFAIIPLPPRCRPYFMEEAFLGELQKMLTVTHMMNVPEIELSAGIKPGVVDKARGEALLARFFL